MKLINKRDQKQVNSDTCGALTELLNDSDIPISITKAVNLKQTTKHAHKESTEIYWVTKGSIRMELTVVDEVTTLDLEEGSILVIEPNEFHRVIEASKGNSVTVLSSPPWKLEDEIH